MEIIENRQLWKEEFERGWLAEYQCSGEIDWKKYTYPKNLSSPAGDGIDLSKSKLAFISSAGGYLSSGQQPFDAGNDLGDYSTRTFPVRAQFSDLAYAHEHYDHTALNEDPQVLMPLRHLENLQKNGIIGELADQAISFMGYQPDITRVEDESIPEILKVLKNDKVDAAFLVPS